MPFLAAKSKRSQSESAQRPKQQHQLPYTSKYVKITYVNTLRNSFASGFGSMKKRVFIRNEGGDNYNKV